MDIDAGLLIFLFIFFVLPLIQKILGAGKEPPPGRRPGQRPPGRLPPQRPDRAPPARHPRIPEGRERPAAAEAPTPARTEMERAAEMIPADLWEILTGERRPEPPRPAPPARPSPEADVDEELAADEEVVALPAYVDEDRAAAELLERRRRDAERDRLVVREPVRIVSLEREPPPEPLRHAAFHKELSTLAPAATHPRTRPLPAGLPSLDSRSDLMRAIVLQEVLGPPRGLE